MVKDISKITLENIETANLETLAEIQICIQERLDFIMKELGGALLEEEPTLFSQARHLENMLMHLDVKVTNLRKEIFLISNEAKIACLRREIAMRERVYPNWVAKGKMKQAQADYEIKVMKGILMDYILKNHEQKN